VSTSPVISACWRLMHHVVKISGARIPWPMDLKASVRPTTPQRPTLRMPVKGNCVQTQVLSTWKITNLGTSSNTVNIGKRAICLLHVDDARGYCMQPHLITSLYIVAHSEFHYTCRFKTTVATINKSKIIFWKTHTLQRMTRHFLSLSKFNTEINSIIRKN